MKCGFCSTSNKSDASICKACGKPLETRVANSDELKRTRKSAPTEKSLDETSKAARKSKFKIVPIVIVLAAVAVGTPIVMSAIGPTNTEPEPTSKTSQINTLGLPVSCRVPELKAIAESILFNQLEVSGKVKVTEAGYSTSWVDVSNAEIQAVETDNPEEYAALTCTYSESGDEDSPYVSLDFDSSPQPRSWRGSVDEEEIKLGFGEKLIVYYPGGGGFLDGGGVLWRVWIDDKYFEINTWSADPKISTLPKNELKSLINILSQGEK